MHDGGTAGPICATIVGGLVSPGRELESAEAEVLVAGHRRPRVVTGEILREHDLLVSRERLAPGREPQPDRFRPAGRTQAVAAPGSQELAGDVVRGRCPQ